MIDAATLGTAGNGTDPPETPDNDAAAGHVGTLLAHFSPILLILAGPAALVALLTGDPRTSALLLPALIAGGAGLLAVQRLALPWHTTKLEAGAAITLVFPAAAILTAVPYLSAGLSPLDAVFESVSALTSTGLSRYGKAISDQTVGLLFLRAWQQWVGGYAIILLVVAFFPRHKEATEDLGEAETGDERAAPVTRVQARDVLFVYAGLTVLCGLLVWAAGTPFREAALHSLTAVSTAGFSTSPDSVGALSPLSGILLIAFAFLGAVALTNYVLPDVPGAALKSRSAIVVVAALVGFGGVFTGVVFALEAGAGNAVSWYDAAFTAFSAQTTTGYSTLTVPELTNSSKVVLSISMLIGGDIGSTAGGIKIVRALLLTAALMRFLPGFGETSDKDTLRQFAIVALTYLGLVIVSTGVLTVDGASFVDALFESCSALGTVGLSAGVTGEAPSALTRLVLISGMCLGRVEAVILVRLLCR